MASGPDSTYGSTASLVEVHGLVDVEYRHQPDQPDVFDVHHAFLYFQSEPVQHLAVRLQIEMEHGAGKDGKFLVDTAEISYFLHDALTVAAGKSYVPVGEENRRHRSTLSRLVSRPLASQALLADEWADIGLWASGKVRLAGDLVVTYDAAVLQGLRALSGEEDVDLQEQDNNSNKTLMAGVHLRWRGLLLGGSGAYGKYDPAARLTYAPLVLSATYERHNVEARVEYLTRTGDHQLDPTAPVIRAVDRGLYAQLCYQFPLGRWGYSIGPVARFDWLQMKQPVPRGDRRLALGVNWRVFEFLRIKGEYNRQLKDPGDTWILAQVAADF